jgi:hypothetical protein
VKHEEQVRNESENSADNPLLLVLGKIKKISPLVLPMSFIYIVHRIIAFILSSPTALEAIIIYICFLYIFSILCIKSLLSFLPLYIYSSCCF